MKSGKKGVTRASAPGRQFAALLPALALVVFVLIAYLPAMRGLFLWDDDHHFSENPLMTAPGGLAALWTQHGFYYPLTSTTFWIARRLWGLNPLPYHLLNALLHGLNCVLLWRLLKRLGVPSAWLAAALFALHPAHAQSVAWMTELKNMQSGLFYLLALHGWVRFREGRGGRFYAMAVISFVLALLSKTSTVTLPLALLAVGLWRRESFDRRALAAWAPLAALSGLAGLLTVVLHRGQVIGPYWSETWPERLILAGRCFWHYLGTLLCPARLAFVYPRWTVDAARPAQWLWVATLPVLFGGLWALRKSGGRPTLVALVYFAISLLPVLNFFKMYYTRYTYVADHWQYLADMGGVAWLGGSLGWLVRRARVRAEVGRLIFAGVLVLLGSLTWRQAFIYRDQQALWDDTIRKNPQAAIAYNNLGTYWIGLGQRATAANQPALAARAYATAEQCLAAGLARNPDNVELLTIHAVALIDCGRPNQALDALERADRLAPRDPEILNNMGLALGLLKRSGDAAHAFERAVAARPDFAEAYYNWARMLADLGDEAGARRALARGLEQLPHAPALLKLREDIRNPKKPQP